MRWNLLAFALLCVGCAQQPAPHVISVTREIAAKEGVMDRVQEKIVSLGLVPGGKISEGQTGNGETRNFSNQEMFVGLTYIGPRPTLDLAVQMRSPGAAPNSKATELLEYFCGVVGELGVAESPATLRGFDPSEIGPQCGALKAKR